MRFTSAIPHTRQAAPDAEVAHIDIALVRRRLNWLAQEIAALSNILITAERGHGHVTPMESVDQVSTFTRNSMPTITR
jgi:hypothetical protein